MTQKTSSKTRFFTFQNYLILAITIFLILSFLAHTTPYFSFDLTLTQNLQSLTIPGLLPFMKFISYWGYYPQLPILVTLISFLLITLKLYWESIISLINITGAYFLTEFLKTLIDRTRPTSNLVHVTINLSDKSFPSGHVLMYTAFFGFICFLTYTKMKPSLLKKILLTILLSLIILIGPSRVYLGNHWPSDVIAGYLIGSVWLLITIYLYRTQKPHVK